jgi:protoheme IX farnesyltransferase
MNPSETLIPGNLRRFRNLALASAIAVFILIVIGGVVRATGTGGACLDWPTCFGSWSPPAAQNALYDYAHRAASLLTLVLLLASAGLAWRDFRRARLLSGGVFAALGLLLVQISLGALVSLTGSQSGWLSGLHLGLALLIEAALLVSSVAAFSAKPAASLKFASPFGRLSLLSLGLLFLLMVSGAVVSASGAAAACQSWPLCDGLQLPASAAAWISSLHRLIVLAAALGMGAQLLKAWRTQRSQPAILTATTAAAVLFFAQALLGARLVQGLPPYLLGLHQATATAAWAALVIQVVATGLAQRTAQQEEEEAAGIAGRKGLLKDLLMLTKPIVVLLLLVTTYAGMVIGAQAWPSAALTFWTLLGGFMAAGGSGAINQYIDRKDDSKMQRTQKRPIPAGRLTPAEGLAFGVGMALASFYLVTAFVNFLAALLTLAGIIYYVLLYSIFLKKTTVQNIVIGGGAGAIPPLVGWAAATGSLNVPSLFLFAIVFMWTPPHFWALAIVRRKDYARAGVPMLPVMRGEKETRWQILLYTLELVGLTLLLPLFGLGGAIYLVGALVLGGWLLSAAWKVYRLGGNKLAWKMYRYSSMYLAFLFLVLMVDRLYH